jgi:hypothetical protein
VPVHPDVAENDVHRDPSARSGQRTGQV